VKGGTLFNQTNVKPAAGFVCDGSPMYSFFLTGMITICKAAELFEGFFSPQKGAAATPFRK
jgi:hypothetical protein